MSSVNISTNFRYAAFTKVHFLYMLSLLSLKIFHINPITTPFDNTCSTLVYVSGKASHKAYFPQQARNYSFIPLRQNLLFIYQTFATNILMRKKYFLIAVKSGDSLLQSDRPHH